MRNPKPRRSIFCRSFALFFVTASIASSQFTQGTITGLVTDPSGAAVPQAKIELLDTRTAAARSAATDDNGLYTFTALQPGPYRLTVTAAAFAAENFDLTLGISQKLTQDIRLQVGRQTQQITVEGASSAVALQQDGNTVSHLVTQTEIASLPVNGRSFLDLASLGAGAQPGGDIVNFSNNGGSTQYFQTTGQQFIPSGQSVGHTTFLQDGVTNTQLFTQAVNILPDMDAIQEFNVNITGGSAQFNQPAVISVITKTGSNSFHGSLYDYLQNSALNANSWFNNLAGTPIAKQTFNQFGGSVGGPVVKNKLFFFFDYQGQRNTSKSTYAGLVPTDAWKAGDFSDYLTGVPCGSGCTQKLALYDPLTYNPTTGTASPFPGNQIPAGRIAGFANQFLQFFPSPNSPILADGFNYHANLPTTNNLDQYQGRVDFNLSENDRLFGEYLYSNQPTISDSFVPNLFGNTYERKGQNIALEETHTFSSSVVNVARLGYNRSVFFNSQLGVGSRDWTGFFGLQNLAPPLQQNSPPAVSITQCCSLGNPYAPQGAVQNLFQFADELDITHGAHTVKLGAEVNRIQMNGNWTLMNSGALGFNGQYTSNYAFNSPAFVQGLGLADFLLGYPSSASGGVGSTIGAFRETDVAGYVDDTWRVRSNLTLSLGFRYQYSSPPGDKYNHAATYSLSQAQSVPGTWDPNTRNFAPRIGIAYSVRPNWVVRSGFGIYYTSTPYNVLQFLLANPPNFLSQSLSYAATAPTPVSTLFPAFAPGSTVFAPFAVDKHNPTSCLEQWNFDLQHTLAHNILIDLGYVGNQGHHLSIRLNPNQALPENPLQPTPIQSRRPYPGVGDVLAQYNIGNSNYNALQASIRKSFSHGLSFQASYTWSKSMDLLSTDGGDLINGLDASRNYGPSDFDRTHLVVLSYTWNLPFGTGQAIYNRPNIVGKYIVGGWQLNGITSFATGLPFTVGAQDFANTGGNHEVVATRTCNGGLSSPTVFAWFDTSCFIQPGVGESGNSGRNILRQGGQKNWDLSLFKNLPITEQFTLQLRGEFFNAFNQHSFVSPDVTVGDRQFGQMTSTTSPRVVQLAMKLLF